MKLQDIQEDLVKLYLRLNGYFTTGLIIHSPTLGRNQTELDTIAVRFPFHNQPDRLISCSEYLQIPKGTIDIIIGEVKSGGEQIQFNTALRNDRTSLEKLINWLGAFDTDEVNEINNMLQTALTPKPINTPDNFGNILFKGKSGNYSIRPIVFSLDRPQPKKNQSRYIYGQLMLDFIWECFRPDTTRQSCSTIYNLNMWGHSLLPIIEYFKDDTKVSVGNIQDYYKHFGLV
jgi:hypothetical protein